MGVTKTVTTSVNSVMLGLIRSDGVVGNMECLDWILSCPQGTEWTDGRAELVVLLMEDLRWVSFVVPTTSCQQAVVS